MSSGCSRCRRRTRAARGWPCVAGSEGLRAADVDDALTDRRTLLITWLNRGTLHLVSPDDYWWLHPLTTPQIVTANERRLRQEGVSEKQAERGIKIVSEAVRDDGPQTRRELRARLDAARVPTAEQAFIHVLASASLRGEIVRGPMRDGEHAFVSVRDWLGDPPPPLARSDALARLALRYLTGHGPAGPRDLAKWAGLTLGDARAGFEHVREHVAEVGDALFDLGGRDPSVALPPPRLLGPFDPLLLGWATRDFVVGPHHVVTTNGIVRTCALVKGRVVATWTLNGETLSLQLLEPLPRTTIGALRKEAADVLRFLDRGQRAEIVVVPPK